MWPKRTLTLRWIKYMSNLQSSSVKMGTKRYFFTRNISVVCYLSLTNDYHVTFCYICWSTLTEVVVKLPQKSAVNNYKKISQSIKTTSLPECGGNVVTQFFLAVLGLPAARLSGNNKASSCLFLPSNMKSLSCCWDS